MPDLLVALGLVLVIEGVLYAAFPTGMKRTLAQVLELPDGTLRGVGLVAAIIGLVLVWIVRG
jgi:uncharacterized protein YjeT (DUF2065 family)